MLLGGHVLVSSSAPGSWLSAGLIDSLLMTRLQEKDQVSFQMLDPIKTVARSF